MGRAGGGEFGSRILGFSTRGLTTGTTSGKAFFKTSDKPKFIEALMATILRNPYSVKCYFRLIISLTIINNLKSDHLLLIKGYLLKCLITVSNSLNECTLNCQDSGPCL